MDSVLNDVREWWDGLPDGTREVLTTLIVIALIWLLRLILVNTLIARLQQIARRRESMRNELALNIIDRPLRYAAIAAALAVTAAALDLGETLTRFINLAANTFFIVAGFLLVYALVSYVTQEPRLLRRFTGLEIGEKLLPFFRTALRVVLIALAAVIILDQWGYDVTGLVAGLGITGLALALAAQDTLSNLFGFTTIVGDQPFAEGEYIKTPDVEGTIERVGLRSTRVRQADQALVTIPNSKLTSTPILNWSRLTRRRYDMTLAIGYETTSRDMRRLLETIRAMLNSRPHVDKNSIVVFFIGFGDSGLEVLVRCYINLPEWKEFSAEREEINLYIMEIVAKLGLSFAAASTTVQIESMSPRPPQTGPLRPPPNR